VTTAAGRRADGYQPDFDIDAAVGHQGQLFVETAMDAIGSLESVEVKTDEETARTGNVYLECECWVSGAWTPSGVNRSAVLWAHVVCGRVVIFAPRELVRDVAMSKAAKPKACMRGSHPTRGRVLPLPQFVAMLAHGAKRGQ
jgi:hypothetical protein